MDQCAVGGLTLAAVTRHRIPVVKMRMMSRIERDLATRVHLQSQIAVSIDLLYGSELAVSQLLLVVRSCKLHAIALGEAPIIVAIDRDPLQSSGIVAQFLSAGTLHGDRVALSIGSRHASILSRSLFRETCFLSSNG